MAAFIRVGGTARRGLLLGGEIAVWTGGNDAVDQNAWSISAAAYLYPGKTRRLFIKGGLGYISHHASDGSDIVVSSGFGPQFGIGYEVRLSPHWRLAPQLDAAFGVVGGGVRFNGAGVQGSGVVSVFQLGMGIIRR
jgi:hypothetical protein